MVADTTIPLSPAGGGGDTMDASSVLQGDGGAVKAERIVLRAESNGHVIAELEWREGSFVLPVADTRVLARLDRIAELLEKINQTLARAHNLIP